MKINKPGRTDRHKLTSFKLFRYWQLQNTSIYKVWNRDDKMEYDLAEGFCYVNFLNVRPDNNAK